MGRQAWRKQLLAGNRGINWIDLLYPLRTNPQICVLKNLLLIVIHIQVFCLHPCLGIYVMLFINMQNIQFRSERDGFKWTIILLSYLAYSFIFILYSAFFMGKVLFLFSCCLMTPAFIPIFMKKIDVVENSRFFFSFFSKLEKLESLGFKVKP